MLDRNLGHYRILNKIGAGGMGEVYRAHDERLDRDVALKILRAGLLADEFARQRFRKEALALAKLNHPNIASVYDFDTDAGVDFLVMEHVAGIALGDKLAAGPLAERELLRLGEQLADGLAAAHEQGVVHRDLKPGNLRLTPDGRLKILDFGLARLVPAGAADDVTASQTRTQAVIGTLPYMAPEQLRGEAAHKRTDIYSCGVVLYEMATRHRPFEHAVSTALAADIQHKAPPPPRRWAPGVSPRLEEIIVKCLEKDPENRYQSAKEIGVDLRRLATSSSALLPSVDVGRRRRPWPLVAAGVFVLAAGALVALNVAGVRGRLFGGAGAGITSLAVLPLVDHSADSSQEYFSDGMTEALIEHLSKIRSLRVISRTSVMPFKKAGLPLPEIAKMLGVDAVVEGSVLRDGPRVRISAKLVRVQPAEHLLWTNSYNREMEDVLALHTEVAVAIAGAIRAELTTEDRADLASDQQVRPDVYEAYLRGRYELTRFATESVQNALGHFEQAVRLDPGYAPAYVGLARVRIAQSFAGIVAPHEIFDRARAAAAKAIELDGQLAGAHAEMGWIKAVADWDWRGAEASYARALELDPGSAEGHAGYSTFLSAVGKHDQAIDHARIALQINPLAPQAMVNLGWRYQGAQQYDKAVEQYRRALASGPEQAPVRANLAEVRFLQGKPDEGRVEMEGVKSILDLMPAFQPQMALDYACVGLEAEARQALEQADELRQRGAYQPAARLGIAYAFLDDRDRAIAELERAFKEHDVWMIFIRWMPQPEWLRGDVRYLSLVRRMNFPVAAS